MHNRETLCVGHVKDAHGIRGELYVYLKTGQADWLDHMTQLLLEVPDGTRQTFEIAEVRPHKKGLIVKTKEILDRTEAEKFKGRKVLVPQSWLVSEPGEDLFFNEIEDFQIEWEGHGVIGPIVGFSSNDWQDLIEVRTEKGVFSIPFVKDFILRIDFKGRLVVMNFPEGLVEI